MGHTNYDPASGLNNLTTSEDEVISISAYFKDKEKRVYTGELATEALFKLDAPEYSIIHISAHTIIDDKEPLFSKIVTGASEKPFEDGYIETHDVLDLKLDAELVVLSACESGLGKLLKGEGIIGLSNAFFTAGASSVISTLWPIEDSNATETMKIFYRALMEEGLSKAEALRRAKLELINSYGILSNPLVWDSFILMGDYR